jgi:hypothetical protein
MRDRQFCVSAAEKNHHGRRAYVCLCSGRGPKKSSKVLKFSKDPRFGGKQKIEDTGALLFVEADLGKPGLGELDHLTVIEGAGQVETALPRLFGVRLEVEIVSHWDSPAIRLSRR